jgi:hypothetical protein
MTSIDEGIDQEARFFQNTEPWRNVENKTLFGTKNLRIKLGELQIRLIRSSFDDIVSEINVQRDTAFQAKTKLGSIPSGLVEKRALFRAVKDKYYNTIGPLVMGGYVRGRMLKVKPSAQFYMASDKFKNELNESRLANISDLAVGVDVIAYVDEEEVTGVISYMTDKDIFISTCNEEPDDYITIPEGEQTLYVPPEVFCRAIDGTVVTLTPIAKNMVRRDPAWIQELIEENRPYKLPIFLNTEVFEQIVSDLIEQDWYAPSMRLLDRTADLMTTAADEYVQQIDSIDSLPGLRNFLAAKSSEIAAELKKDAKFDVIAFVDRECTPYTQNNYLIENISKLRSKRLMDEVLAMVGGYGTIETAAVQTIIRNVFERNQARSMDDHMAEEMQHALNAYGKVAMKRFMDTIPMICVDVLQSFPDRINDALSETMDTEIDRLVAAPPDWVRAMKEYERMIKTLDNGIAAIKMLY